MLIADIEKRSCQISKFFDERSTRHEIEVYMKIDEKKYLGYRK